MTLISALPQAGTYQVTGSGFRPSAFAVSPLATASVAGVGLELSRLIAALGLTSKQPEVTVDHRLASLWFGWSYRPRDWEAPSVWDAIAGVYETSDGFIRLHTNLPHHRAAALRVLGCDATREAVAAAVKTWDGDALESQVVAEGGASAFMRSRADWQAHPQGQAVAADPLIGWPAPRSVTVRERPETTAERPLAGLRVLDLTRVLAGPVSTRTLAAFGADVLRIDPPGWDEPGVIPDITPGKRCAFLDLKTKDGLDHLHALLAEADVLVHGYRPGALDALGLDRATRDQLAPNRVEVTLDAYGWQGPWSGRRGFDSLVQMSAGIAATGQDWAGADTPVPLPVQALDHATGYLMAAAVLSALANAARGDEVSDGRLSLARTAEELAGMTPVEDGGEISKTTDADFAPTPEHSVWGQTDRLRAPLQVGAAHMRWDRPAGPVGTAEARW
ncbi:MAG: CoA transferase [Paracoccaceae bacterium]